MTPRSLVGMTMGARKRACREDQKLEVAGEDMSAAALSLLHEIRLMYRIGQRLRLCPGCKTCGYEPTVKMWKLSRDALWMSGRLGVRYIRHICDGSGVLPAKGKVRR